MMSVQLRVLVAEDDEAIRSLIVAALRRETFEVDEAADGIAALELTGVTEYAVIILDLMMPRLSGFDFLEAFHRATPAARSVIIVLTAFDESMLAQRHLERAHAIMRKPFDVPQLVTIVREVATAWSALVIPATAQPDAPFPLAPEIALPRDEPVQ
jgi:two-component system, OmpR family, alkaline phosphatase synthesis response regulator PhoP